MSKVDKNELKIIFQGIKNGDEKSFEILYDKYYSTVFGIAFSILKNNENSEDITQNVFTKIYKMNKDLLPCKGEASWLYMVTKNEVMQFLRSQKSTANFDDMYTIESENSEIEDFIDMSSYHKLVEKLDPIDREIVSLRIISDFTFDKIAQMLDMPLGTVQWRYYKSLHYVKASITNLATYIVLITTLQIARSNIGLTSVYDGIDSTNTSNYNEISTINTETFNAAEDISGASSSIQRIIGASLTLSMIFITIVFIIVMIYFLVKKKIKIKNSNKINMLKHLNSEKSI